MSRPLCSSELGNFYANYGTVPDLYRPYAVVCCILDLPFCAGLNIDGLVIGGTGLRLLPGSNHFLMAHSMLTKSCDLF